MRTNKFKGTTTLTLPKDLASLVNRIHAQLTLKGTPKSKSQIMKDFLEKGIEATGIDKNQTPDENGLINLGDYGMDNPA